MKKLLSVLLALSVVFTYTVGTAFAVTAQDATELDAYKAQAVSQLENYPNKSDYSTGNWVVVQGHVQDGRTAINAADREGLVDNALAEAKAKIDAVTKVSAESLETYKTTAKAALKDYSDLMKKLAVYDGTTLDTDAALLKANTAIDAAKATAEVDAAVLAGKEAIDALETKAQIDAKADATALVKAKTDTEAALRTWFNTQYNKALYRATTQVEITTLLNTQIAEIKAAKTVAEVEAIFKGGNGTAVTKITSKLAADTNVNLTLKDAQDEIAAIKAGLKSTDYTSENWTKINNVVVAGATLAEIATSLKDAKTAINDVETILATAQTAAKEAVKTAANVKPEDYSSANIKLVAAARDNGYNAIAKATTVTAVDEAKENAIKEIAVVRTLADSDATFVAAQKTAVDAVNANLAIETGKAGITAAQKSELNAEAKDMIAKINAAHAGTTFSDADTKTPLTTLADYYTALAANRTTAIAQLTFTDANYSPANVSIIEGHKSAAKLTINTADTKTAIDAAVAGFEAKRDAVKTIAVEDQDAADAVIALINAIGTVTTNSKTAIDAAEKAYAALTSAQQAKVTNYATLTAAKAAYTTLSEFVTKLELEMNKFELNRVNYYAEQAAEIDKIFADAKADIEANLNATDKGKSFFDAAVDAVAAVKTKAQIDAANEAAATFAKDYIAPVKSLLTYDKTLKETYIKKIEAEINKLDATKTGEALKSAYLAAKTAIATIEKEAASGGKITAGVKNTTIKVSTKAYKGYNQINWKKSYGYKVDGYQVYKSTKKTGTFKFMGSTTKTTMKNAKGLKKGTKYYYKVKGYRMIDGVKVFTKESNLGIRTAK